MRPASGPSFCGLVRGFFIIGPFVTKRRIELGLLYSRSGSYSLIAEACRTGFFAAVAQINGDPDLDITFVPVERDPGGNADAYGLLCEDILRNSTARHVVGCTTSWSRKEVIPTLEKLDGTLWYTAPYEGFEASDRVVYTHACPNQHLLPLLDWVFPAYGRRGYLTGSNYIWGWEISRLARETVTATGGEVLGERYLPIGSRDVDRIIDEIRATRPNFILNSLIGPSSYQFMAALRALGQADAAFMPDRCPVLSCNLTECELPALGQAAEGLIAAGPYFRGATQWPGPGSFGSSHEAATFAAVTELARLIAHRPGAEHENLASLLAHASLSMIDRKTHHTRLPVLIAQVRDGAFHILQDRGLTQGDPYLTRLPERPVPNLRVVS